MGNKCIEKLNKDKDNTLINFYSEYKLYNFAIHYFIFPKMTYNSQEEIIKNRKTISENIDFLKDKFKFDINLFNLDFGLGITYPLSYQNMNNVTIYKKYCNLFRTLIPDLNYKSNHIDNSFVNKLETNKKIKIAFFSEYLIFNHSVTRDRSGIIQNLSRDIYDIYLITFKNKNHSNCKLVKDLWNSVPKKNHIFLDRNIKNSQKNIASLELDILIFCEIGMSLHAYFLAFSRLATIQCNTWGHSDTAGIDTIDYFISSKKYELDLDKSQKNYSEKLILTDHLCTYYYNPIEMYLSFNEKNNLLDRDFFNLPKDKKIYACLQSPFKITHEYDFILKRILEYDNDSLIIMLDNEANILKNQILTRLEINLGKNLVDRIIILNKMNSYHFYSLLKNCDVALDSFPFGGCNTTFECMALNIPVITLPSDFINGRFTFGIYKTMGINELIAHDCNDYINLAIQYANDTNLREKICNKISENNHKIFMQKNSIDDWDILLKNLYLTNLNKA